MLRGEYERKAKGIKRVERRRGEGESSSDEK